MTPDDRRRGPDLLGVVFLGLLAAGALGAIYEILSAGYMTAGALVGVIGVCGAFAAVHAMGSRPPSPKNTFAHGDARTATEAEAQAAARGVVKPKPAHEQKFSD